jgi:hypothetical protein
MVTDVKEGKVFVDYKDEGVHAIPLKSSGWNCSTNDILRKQNRWCMLAKNTPKQKQQINQWVYKSLSLPPSHDRKEPTKNGFLVNFCIELK